MKLSQKWRDAMWSEAAMKVLGVLHDLGTVKSIRELSRVTGLHEFYIRELIAGAKRHRSKLKHLVRYTKIKHGVKTSCDITVHGRMFFHLLRVTDIPTDDELSLLARCAELSAKRKGRTEIVPDAIGIFKEVWDEMMNCECCRATLADDKVIKITREGLEAVIKGMNLDKSAANRHRTDIALTSHRHRTDIALTSLPCTLVPYTPLPNTLEAAKNFETMKEPVGGTDGKETHKGGTERGKCPRCGQERSQFRMFVCSDPRVRAKDEQLEVWHGVVVCWACYDELTDIKWRVIERGEW